MSQAISQILSLTTSFLLMCVFVGLLTLTSSHCSLSIAHAQDNPCLAQDATISAQQAEILRIQLTLDVAQTQNAELLAQQSSADVIVTAPTSIPNTATPQNLVAQAYALENARLWSKPNVNDGSIIADLSFNTPLLILDGPITGDIRYNSDIQGEWYQVQVTSDPDTVGWLWVGRIEFIED